MNWQKFVFKLSIRHMLSLPERHAIRLTGWRQNREVYISSIVWVPYIMRIQKRKSEEKLQGCKPKENWCTSKFRVKTLFMQEEPEERFYAKLWVARKQPVLCVC